ncbi:MAG: PIG-L family deacetylase [Kouleothrix sp.]|nr:PIG-L family deacetylase [Kouleothrix sp.]
METIANDRGRPRILGVFAHPDDETFCAGGALAKYVAAGWEAMVVSATRGQAGQIRDARVATRRTLGQVRERELHEACRRLGVQRAEVLDYMDGTLKDVDQRELTGAVVGIVRAFQPDVVITFGADGAYGHPDHVAISLATSAACGLAGSPEQFPEQLAGGLAPHRPDRLYHSHFPRSRLLLLDQLARWLGESATRFRGTADFVRALSLFAQEATTLRYAGDHVDVDWFPAGFYIVEQGEPGASLYLILSGHADVMHEEPDGSLRRLRQLGPGEFFGELAIVRNQPRTAHVVAADDVTCLVFAPGAPSAYDGRGEDARIIGGAAPGDSPDEPASGATACIDVSAYVDQKIAAVAAHRTQYPIEPDMFPPAMLQEMLGREYFVRVQPPLDLATAL